MTDHHQRRGLFRCLWLAAAVALILLLVVSATHHQAPYLCFVLVPVFLFAVVVTQERCFVREVKTVSSSQLYRPSLFQRPPPSLI